jgi:hypothetical protein
MVIRGSCPACGLPLQVSEGSPGSKYRCGKCGVVLVITEGGEFVTEPSPVAPAPGHYREAEGIAEGRGAGGRPERRRRQDEDDEVWLPPLRLGRVRRSAALARVSAPATVLQTCGILVALGGVALPVIVAFQPPADSSALVLSLIGGFLCLALGGLFFLGGTRMKALRSYRLATTAVLLFMVVALLLFGPLGVVGFWPLIVLMDAEVKANFDRPEE